MTDAGNILGTRMEKNVMAIGHDGRSPNFRSVP
jgi:hypothetical protein